MINKIETKRDFCYKDLLKIKTRLKFSIPIQYLEYCFVLGNSKFYISRVPRTASRSRDCIRCRTQLGDAKKGEANALNAALGPKGVIHCTPMLISLLSSVSWGALAPALVGIFQLIFFPHVSLSPDVRVFWGTRAAPDIDRVLVYTRAGSNRADTEAKWSRINQRRPIINELRLRPPRVCIKTRLFVTHLSRVRPVLRSAFVITLRRQTVSIRRREDCIPRCESDSPFLRANERRADSS